MNLKKSKEKKKVTEEVRSGHGSSSDRHAWIQRLVGFYDCYIIMFGSGWWPRGD